MTEYRLVVQTSENRPWGVYSSTDRRYFLQTRNTEASLVWRTIPVIHFETLSKEEKAEIVKAHRGVLI